MEAIDFYREQWRRYLLPVLAALLLDFLLLFISPEFAVRSPLIAVLSGMLGGFVRFLIAEQTPIDKLHDTANMLSYWLCLAVGGMLGVFSYLLLLDGRLVKVIYPRVALEIGGEPSAASVAIIAALAGLLVKQIVASVGQLAKRPDQ